MPVMVLLPYSMNEPTTVWAVYAKNMIRGSELVRIFKTEVNANQFREYAMITAKLSHEPNQWGDYYLTITMPDGLTTIGFNDLRVEPVFME